MGGLHSRNKGKAGEREVRDLFRKVFRYVLRDVSVIRRNHQQAEIGGADLVGVPFMSVEVKRVKQITWGKGLMDWWEQCVVQADTDGLKPCLVFRQDHGKWLVMVGAYPEALDKWTPSYPMIMQWDQFEHWLQLTTANRELEFLK
jgi:hypothetical protein